MSIIKVKLLLKYIIPTGIFHGSEKLSSVNTFLNCFIIVILNILKNGINVDDHLFKIKIAHIKCTGLSIFIKCEITQYLS